MFAPERFIERGLHTLLIDTSKRGVSSFFSLICHKKEKFSYKEVNFDSEQ